ncbi:alpha/beta hydrolase [Microbacterium sp. F2E]|uniref:alpha/beta fold hydrolase n=1 Tax=Microbacterium sp. F2E TaxID=2895284 RepID=UPI001E392DCC|nr:alpha/beta hydrolase [Microbacterium sp. F2E]MCC9053531.1 alpha/beta hydrolase [Microbacterium sp. F2E]
MSEEPVMIIFEHGILSGGFAWEWVVSRLPDRAVPIVHDRQGTSTFDIAFRRTDYHAVKSRLDHLLPLELKRSARVVLVGHSIGGLLVRAHAHALGARLAGIVYVDPSPPEQFEPATDTDYQFLRLQQLLLKHAARSTVNKTPNASDVEVINLLPSRVREGAIHRLTDHRFWLNAYREARSAGNRWLDAAIFPEFDNCPTVVVSSSVSARPDSLQNQFEERLLSAANPSMRILAREASHETVVYDERESTAVNRGIDWVLKEVEA